ncbi:MAG TPA: hypothetical protein VKH63_16125 [Candidatus Acidoferrum sp.]|nr:hypothetical protein [Candidatus Acidoferrum sp.]
MDELFEGTFSLAQTNFSSVIAAGAFVPGHHSQLDVGRNSFD